MRNTRTESSSGLLSSPKLRCAKDSVSPRRLGTAPCSVATNSPTTGSAPSALIIDSYYDFLFICIYIHLFSIKRLGFKMTPMYQKRRQIGHTGFRMGGVLLIVSFSNLLNEIG